MELLHFKKQFLVCVVYFGILHLVTCLIDKEHRRIFSIGSYIAPPGTGLHHASIQNASRYHLCGSAIISDRHVLTAAHCVFGKNPSSFRIVVGTTNLDLGGDYYYVDFYQINSEYIHSVLQNDIAVIKIRGIFNFINIQIIKLSPIELQQGDEVFLVSFGAQSISGTTIRLMQYLYLPVINQYECNVALRTYGPVTDRMFCTFTTFGQGACKGDSGSPVTMNNQLVGLVSWGIPCALGLPDVYTRINRYIPWIIQQTEY